MTGRGKPARKARRALPRKAMIVVGLALFIAVDIVLIALASGWGRDEPRAAASMSPTQTAQPEEDFDQTEPADQSPSETDVDAPQVVPRLLSVTSDSVAWRSEGGTCDERGSLELTVDGGDTWGAAYPPADELGRPLWVSELITRLSSQRLRLEPIAGRSASAPSTPALPGRKMTRQSPIPYLWTPAIPHSYCGAVKLLRVRVERWTTSQFQRESLA